MGKFLDALKNIGAKVNGKTPTSTTTVAVLNEIADDFANGTTATKEYVNSLMSGALKRAIVEELPTEDIDPNTIYMVLDSEAASGNVYNEYLYIEEAWELIGTTAVQNLKTYIHTVELTESLVTTNDRKVIIELEDTRNTALTYAEIVELCTELKQCTGYTLTDNTYNAIWGCKKQSGNNRLEIYYNNSNALIDSNATLVDHIREAI